MHKHGRERGVGAYGGVGQEMEGRPIGPGHSVGSSGILPCSETLLPVKVLKQLPTVPPSHHSLGRVTGHHLPPPSRDPCPRIYQLRV